MLINTYMHHLKPQYHPKPQGIAIPFDNNLYIDIKIYSNILHSGVGLFLGFELVKDRVLLTPATEEAALLVRR